MALLVDPGENVWPTQFFGNLSHVPLDQISGFGADFVGSPGIRSGYDWSLPKDTLPARRGLLTMFRTFNLQPTPPMLPTLRFRATAVHSVWVRWKELEPTEGTYDFALLRSTFKATKDQDWLLGLRLLTSRIEYAPSYLSGRSSVLEGGANYDPADAYFHARYLALLRALKGLDLCSDDAFAVTYVGYASSSLGDEYIGPHGPGALPGDPAVAYPHVRERLDAWASVCAGHANKVMMGGFSAYGAALGFGTRNGFVEHYWYLIPDAQRGQQISDRDPYLRVNESALLLSGDRILGEENEEYSSDWSSDWRTWLPGERGRGGAWNSSAPPQGHHARYGPLASFPYRYLMSSMRILQMRVNHLLASRIVVNPELFCYMALSIGKRASDASDAFTFLASAHFTFGRGLVSNFERYLHQRSEPAAEGGGGMSSQPDARITQTPAPPSNVRAGVCGAELAGLRLVSQVALTVTGFDSPTRSTRG